MGAVLGVMAMGEADASATTFYGSEPWQQHDSARQSFALGADVSFGVGAAVAVTGVALLIFAPDAAPEAEVSVLPTHHGAFVTFSMDLQ